MSKTQIIYKYKSKMGARATFFSQMRRYRVILRIQYKHFYKLIPDKKLPTVAESRITAIAVVFVVVVEHNFSHTHRHLSVIKLFT